MSAYQIPLSLNTKEFKEIWEEWIGDKKERKSKLTSRAMKMQLEKLEKMGPNTAVESIKRSIERGWTTVYEPTDKNTANPSPIVNPWRPMAERVVGAAKNIADCYLEGCVCSYLFKLKPQIQSGDFQEYAKRNLSQKDYSRIEPFLKKYL